MLPELREMQKFGDGGRKIVKKPFVPSKYQSAVFDWIKHGEGHLMIDAVAGSGKTTTLIESIQTCSDTAPGKIVFMSFGNKIVSALAAKIPAGTGAKAYTFNAFGWGIYRENFKDVKLDKYKDLGILRRIVDERVEKARFSRIRGPVLQMVSLLKATLEPFDQWEKVASEYGIELNEIKPMDRFPDVLSELFRRSTNDLRVANFDDQCYQPVVHNWPIPQYRWVLLDEFQDTSKMNMELALRASHNSRMICVGDPDQSVYYFRGAHPDAMGTMARELSAAKLPLSICYRCPDKIIESAQKQVPRIEKPVPNPRGEGVLEWITTKAFRENIKPGDVVLCRTTAPLVKRCLQDIRDGRKAYVLGRELGDGLVALIEKIHGNEEVLHQDFIDLFEKKVKPHEPDVPIFLQQVTEYFDQQSYRLEQQNREAELITLDSNVETIRALAESCDYVVELIKRIQEIFEDDDALARQAITYMTMHRAKGLEFDRVFILRLDLCPHKRAKSIKAKQQDKNLLYVAKTRSMAELYFVKKEQNEK